MSNLNQPWRKAIRWGMLFLAAVFALAPSRVHCDTRKVRVQFYFEPGCYDRDTTTGTVEAYSRASVAGVSFIDTQTIEVGENYSYACDARTDEYAQEFGSYLQAREQSKSIWLEVGNSYTAKLTGSYLSKNLADTVLYASIPCSGYHLQVTQIDKVLSDGTSTSSAVNYTIGGQGQSEVATIDFDTPEVTVTFDVVMTSGLDVVRFTGEDCGCAESTGQNDSLRADGESSTMAYIPGIETITSWELVEPSLDCKLEPQSSGNYQPYAYIHAGLEEGPLVVRAHLESGECVEGLLKLVCAEGSNCLSGDCSVAGNGKLANRNGPRLELPLGSAFGTRGGVKSGADFLLWAMTGAPPIGDLLYSPQWLTLPFIQPGVQVVRDAQGIRQVRLPDGLVDVVSSPLGVGFELRFFRNSQVEDLSGPLYPTTGDPYLRWQIVKADAPTGKTAVEIVRQDHSTSEVDRHRFEWDSTGQHWDWIDPTETRIERSKETLSGVDTIRMTEYRTQSNQVIFSGSRTTRSIDDVERIVSSSVGLGVDIRTTARTYYSATETPPENQNRLKQVDYPDGTWIRYTYTTGGRVATRVEPIGNQAPSVSDGSARVTKYVYAHETAALSLEGHTGDDATLRPDIPRMEAVEVAGVEISRIFRQITLANTGQANQELVIEEQQCPDPHLDWNDAKNLKTITRFYYDTTQPGTPEFNQIKSVIRPDLTGETYTYALDAQTGGMTTTVRSVPDNPKGRETRTLVDMFGQLVSRKVYWVAAGQLGPLMESEVHSNPDADNRYRTTTYLDGSTTTREFGCCGPESVTDRYGVTQTPSDPVQSPDGLHLVHELLTSPFEITTIETRDLAGNLVKRERKGSDHSIQVLDQMSYNTAGELVTQTNPLNGVTTTSRQLVSSQWEETVTHPDTGTEVRRSFRDGRLDRVTGTAVFPVRYEYGVEAVSGVDREFTKEIRLDENGNDTQEWTKTYVDALGRTLRREYPPIPPATESPYETWTYEQARHRLIQQRDADGYIRLFGYNAEGERTREAADLNKNGSIDEAGTDLITDFSETQVLYTDPFTGSTVESIQRHTDRFDTDNQGYDVQTGAGKTDIATETVSLDGLIRWSTRYRDSNTKVTTKQIETLPVNGNHTQTTYRPDGVQEVSSFQNGRLVSTVRLAADSSEITRQDYRYDAHGRQYQVTDARVGTTSFGYNAADLVTTVTRPPSAAGQAQQNTTTHYDASLRIDWIQQPDGTMVHREYTKTGLLEKQYGSRVYSVEYTYDAQGRLLTQKTWQDYPTLTGEATTRWNYNPYRGWLDSKDYPYKDNVGAQANSGPSYQYTDAGRLQTRSWKRGVNTVYSYTNAGQLDGIDYSDSTPDVDYDYDRQGRLKSTSQAYTTALTTTFTYNDADQLLTKAFAGSHLGGLGGDRVYDDKLRLTSVSWTSSGAAQDTTQYAFHVQHGRLESVTKAGEVMTYGYLNQSDWVETLSYGASSRLITQRVYDGLDRLERIDSTVTGASVPFASIYRHNDANQRDRVTAEDGSYWAYEYDDLGQVTSGKRHWLDGTEVLGQTFTYQHDDIGNRELSGGRASSDSDYDHNRRNELTGDQNLSRSVDVIGLADPSTSITVNTEATTRQGGYYHKAVTFTGSGASMETITVSDGTQSSSGDVFVPGTGARTYDDDGNLIQDGRWHYLWDAENRLIQMHSVGAVPTANQRRVEFNYDHAGRRIAKRVYNQVSGGALLSESKYLYDGWNLIAELDSSNAPKMTYAWGLDMSGTLQGAGGVGGLLLVTDHATGKDHYVDIDGQGNVKRLVDSSDGSLSAEYEYGPFGEPLRATGTMASKNRIRFSTKYDDPETRLLYYGMRYYNPTTGRWISRDPIGEDGGLNLYGFVGNDPTNSLDVLGLYQEAGHFYTVYYIGEAAGYTPEEAFHLAYYTQLPDEFFAFDATAMGFAHFGSRKARAEIDSYLDD